MVPDSSMVTLIAEPIDLDDRVVFDHWNDGDTTNPREILVVSDTAFTAYFRVEGDSLGIHDCPSFASKINVFPNPTYREVVMETTEDILHAFLADMVGHEQPASLSSRGDGRYVFDLSSLPQGHYLLTIVTADGRRHSVRLTKLN
jgi:hypothetical protein